MSMQSPGSAPPPSGGAPPSNWMVPAILSLLCCWPLSIPAIVFATRVNNSWNAGDYAGAEEAAGKAKRWAITSIVVGLVGQIVFWILWVLFLGAMFTAANEVDAEMQELDEEVQELEEMEEDLGG